MIFQTGYWQNKRVLKKIIDSIVICIYNQSGNTAIQLVKMQDFVR